MNTQPDTPADVFIRKLAKDIMENAPETNTQPDNEMVKRAAKALHDELYISDLSYLAEAVVNAVMEWRDIESAPRDATSMLLYGRMHPFKGLKWSKPLVFSGYWDEIDEAWCATSSTWEGPFFTPTKWMPLPLPPLPSVQEGKEDTNAEKPTSKIEGNTFRCYGEIKPTPKGHKAASRPFSGLKECHAKAISAAADALEEKDREIERLKKIVYAQGVIASATIKDMHEASKAEKYREALNKIKGKWVDYNHIIDVEGVRAGLLECENIAREALKDS